MESNEALDPVEKYLDFILFEVFESKLDILVQVIKSPSMYIINHIDSIKFSIDICVEKILNENKLDKGQQIEIEKRRSLMLGKLALWEMECLKNLDKKIFLHEIRPKLFRFVDSFRNDLKTLIRSIILNDYFNPCEWFEQIYELRKKLFKEIKQIKSLVFLNKWTFFRENKDIIDFGKLILIDHVFEENVMNFSKSIFLNHFSNLKN